MSTASRDPEPGGQEMPMQRQPPSPMDDRQSVDTHLSDLKYGARSVVSVVAPVTVCMLLVVATVRSITYFSADAGVYLPYVIMDEASSTSDLMRFGGALVNALIIIGVVAVMTFVLVCCYKYHCYKLITVWLALSTVILLFFFAFTYWEQALAFYNVPMDWFTTIFVIYNFGVVGLLCIFWRGPLRLQQAYLIMSSALMALTFMTRLPLWTTWTLLAFIAVWDLIAVLCPKGPLRMLVETAQQRNEPLFPALIYSSRANMVWTVSVADIMQSASVDDSLDRTQSPAQSPLDSSSRAHLIQPSPRGSGGAAPLFQEAFEHSDQSSCTPNGTANQHTCASPSPQSPPPEDEGEGVKLGLGDFIFYSILVGTAAAKKDWGTILSCFLAILMGLCLTLLLLAVYQRALPALPISIALGLVFYFVTSILVAPLTDTLSGKMLFT